MERVDYKNLTENIFKVLEDKKGEDIAVYDVRKLTAFTDYMIIASFNSGAQLKAVTRELKKGITNNPDHVEGDARSGWILIDFNGVVLNLFLEDQRKFYGLDRMWGEAEKMEFKDV